MCSACSDGVLYFSLLLLPIDHMATFIALWYSKNRQCSTRGIRNHYTFNLKGPSRFVNRAHNYSTPITRFQHIHINGKNKSWNQGNNPLVHAQTFRDPRPEAKSAKLWVRPSHGGCQEEWEWERAKDEMFPSWVMVRKCSWAPGTRCKTSWWFGLPVTWAWLLSDTRELCWQAVTQRCNQAFQQLPDANHRENIHSERPRHAFVNRAIIVTGYTHEFNAGFITNWGWNFWKKSKMAFIEFLKN